MRRPGATVAAPLRCSNSARVTIIGDFVSVDTWENIAGGYVPVSFADWEHIDVTDLPNNNPNNVQS